MPASSCGAVVARIDHKVRVQVSSDGLTHYVTAVENAFGWGRCDYAQIVKEYGCYVEVENGERRYSPSTCTGFYIVPVMGNPDVDRVSTSHVQAVEPHDPDAAAPVHPARQRLLPEGGESGARRVPALHVVQLRTAPPDDPHHARVQGGCGGPGVEPAGDCAAYGAVRERFAAGGVMAVTRLRSFGSSRQSGTRGAGAFQPHARARA